MNFTEQLWRWWVSYRLYLRVVPIRDKEVGAFIHLQLSHWNINSKVLLVILALGQWSPTYLAPGTRIQ